MENTPQDLLGALRRNERICTRGLSEDEQVALIVFTSASFRSGMNVITLAERSEPEAAPPGGMKYYVGFGHHG